MKAVQVAEPILPRLRSQLGSVFLHIHAQLPLDEAALPHEMVETRKSIGKIILLPAEETVA